MTVRAVGAKAERDVVDNRGLIVSLVAGETRGRKAYKLAARHVLMARVAFHCRMRPNKGKPVKMFFH